MDRFDVDASGLHLDLATISFVGAYPDSTLVKKGWDRTGGYPVRSAP